MAELRHACDRCHNKKLRCPRLPDSLCCSRCSKANVQCIFSPPTRALRPEIHNVAFDWPSLMDLDGSNQVYPDILATPPTSSLPSSDGASMNEASQLAEMMVALDGIWRHLSSQNFHHASRQDLKRYVDELSHGLGLHAVLEQLLLHAQRLVVLYPEVQKLALRGMQPPTTNESCSIPDCIHHDHGREEILPRPQPRLDHALLSLLLSCHLRLLDTFDTLTEHGNMCNTMTAALQPDYDPKFDIPEIRIGSFVAPKEAAASMLLSMLLELHGKLIARVGLLLLAVPCTTGDDLDECQIARLQCARLKTRAEVTLTELLALKETLVNAGVMS